MNNVVMVSDDREKEAQQNIQRFIVAGKTQLRLYPKNLSWDDTEWNLTGVVNQRPGQRSEPSIAFRNFDTTNKVTGDAMSTPFIDFAKSYFLNYLVCRGSQQIFRPLLPLRVLERALVNVKHSSNVEKIDARVMSVSITLLCDRYGEQTAYQAACELELIVKLLNSKRLLIKPFQWANPIPCPKIASRLGPEAEIRRQEKLPSDAAVLAMPQCFHRAVFPGDIVLTSIMAIMTFLPVRISEVLALRYDCEYECVADGELSYGLRWWPRKGADPMIKWVPPYAIDIIKLAISRVKEVCAPAREVAKWYEDVNNGIYIPDNLNHLRRNRVLSVSEIQQINGGDRNIRRWLRQFLGSGQIRQTTLVTAADMSRYIRASLPVGFPKITGGDLNFSEALFVLRKDEIGLQRGIVGFLVEEVGMNQIHDRLGNSNILPLSIFHRMGFTEPNGDPIRVHTHQFRHRLQTVQLLGGGSQLDAARWAGRKNVSGNNSYDHVSPTQLLDSLKSVTENAGGIFENLSKLPINSPIKPHDIVSKMYATAHLTEIGVCFHDFAALPCLKYLDCINCNEHVCVKGDLVRLKRLTAMLDMEEEMLKTAQEAAKDAFYGADRWIEQKIRTIDRLKDVIRAVTDPALKDGALVSVWNAKEVQPLMVGKEMPNIGSNAYKSIKDEVRPYRSQA